MKKSYVLSIVLAVIGFLTLGVASAGVVDMALLPADLSAFPPIMASFSDNSMLGMTALAGIGNIDLVTKQITSIENAMNAFIEKANEEIKSSGVASKATKAILDKLGENQKEVADRLLSLEQNNQSGGGGENAVVSLGGEFTGSDNYKNYAAGNSKSATFTVQNNTVTGDDATVAPDRKPGIVPGAVIPLTLESFLPSVPTTSNAIEFTRELLFTNNAAEVAEGGAKPETSITFELATMPISTVAHWVRISKQLSQDAPALAAYINNRMMYGVDRRVETQLGGGDGVSPNISGLQKAGNFTAHAYTAAALGGTLPKLVLIRKLIADAWAAGYPADAILLNPADWADVEIELLTTTANQVRVSTDSAGNTRLWGVAVIQSVAIAADTLLVGAFGQSTTIHNRQGVVVDLSESDATNFTSNLITIRAERRLALTVDRPAAILGGDLTPI